MGSTPSGLLRRCGISDRRWVGSVCCDNLGVNLLDGIVVVLALGFAVSGYQRGLSRVGLALAGLFVGIVVGTLAAPPVSRYFASPPTPASTRSLVATITFLVCVFVFQGIGTLIGFRLRARTLRTRGAGLDSGLGAVAAIAGVLIAAWYIGLTFQDSRFPELDRQIQNSRIIGALDSVAPRIPAPLARIRQALADRAFPDVFAGLGGSSVARVPIPRLLNTPGIRAATGATVKVVADSAECGSRKAGSGWPASPTSIVTNAHVVAGSNRVQVVTAAGDVRNALVIHFNPDDDVAVLSVRDGSFAPLTLSPTDPIARSTGVVIGYPLGGDERVVPAAIRGSERATGYDIYGTREVTRTIEVLAATVVSGNSGGPVVDTSGTVVGLVFAASETDASEAYALAPSQIRDDLAGAVGATTPVDTQGCG